jgi:hypothetical protein
MGQFAERQPTLKPAHTSSAYFERRWQCIGGQACVRCFTACFPARCDGSTPEKRSRLQLSLNFRHAPHSLARRDRARGRRQRTSDNAGWTPARRYGVGEIRRDITNQEVVSHRSATARDVLRASESDVVDVRWARSTLCSSSSSERSWRSSWRPLHRAPTQPSMRLPPTGMRIHDTSIIEPGTVPGRNCPLTTRPGQESPAARPAAGEFWATTIQTASGSVAPTSSTSAVSPCHRGRSRGQARSCRSTSPTD